MRDMLYRLMCLAHSLAKRILRRQAEPVRIRFVDVALQDAGEDGTVAFTGLPGSPHAYSQNGLVKIDQLYPVENAGLPGSNLHLRESFGSHRAGAAVVLARSADFSPELWRAFIGSAEIAPGYRNAGLKYAGYVASGRNTWCLPSWIWTNAATVRYLCSADDVAPAKVLGEKLLSLQQDEGGWIVRSDFTLTDEIPMMAPNDSAYIANNACLSLFDKTRDDRFLEAARRCADWIIATARPDGLVWTGFDKKNEVWLKKHTIVDTGFTAGLFANLYMATNDSKYRSFLDRFSERFVELFHDPVTGGFATSIDDNDCKKGGRFARGQAWALEGLIPTYRALGGTRVKDVILASVNSLLRHQLPNGGWAYNLDRPYFGEDCKGVSVIAKSLMNWHSIHPDERLPLASGRALDWCKQHTAISGEARGGIFSFNLEGAVVHNLYSETAFVYSSAYALEALQMLTANG